MQMSTKRFSRLAAYVAVLLAACAGSTCGDDLVEGTLVAGTLRDGRSGKPIAGGTVTAYLPDDEHGRRGTWQAGVSDHGIYRLNLPPGTYELQAASPGYEHPGRDDGMRIVTVKAGEALDGQDISLTREPKLGGTVVDADGRPVAGAVVRTLVPSFRDEVTDAEGRFRVSTGLPGLPAELCIVAPERGLVCRQVVTEETDELQVVVEPGAVAVGRVVNPGGKGLAGLEVTALYNAPVDRGNQTTYVYLPGALTDGGGAFRLAWLPHGVPITVYVNGEDGRFISDRRWPETVTLEAGAEVDLGQTVLDRAGVTVAGRVMDAERELVAECMVVEVRTRRVVQTDEQGRFELTGIPILFWAALPGERFLPDIIVIGPERSRFCAAVSIDPGWEHELDLILEPPGKVRGRIVDADGAPVAGATMHLEAARVRPHQAPPQLMQLGDVISLHADTQTAADGVWQFEGLIPGLQYVVSATDGPAGRALFHKHFMPIPGETVDLGDLGGKQEN